MRTPRCLPALGYRRSDQLLIDATQIIPLPESLDYEIKIRTQAKETKKVKTVRQEIFRRFWSQLIERSRARTGLFANRSTSTDHWLSGGIGRAGFSLSLSLIEDRARAECYIRIGKDNDVANKAAFSALRDKRETIEAGFGDSLDWQELPDRSGSRICKDLPGGWKTAEGEWPDLQDRMIDAIIRLERALKQPVQGLKI